MKSMLAIWLRNPHYVFAMMATTAMGPSLLVSGEVDMMIGFFLAATCTSWCCAFVLQDVEGIKEDWLDHPQDSIYYTRTISVCFLIEFIGTLFYMFEFLVNDHRIDIVAVATGCIIVGWMSMYIVLGKMEKILFS